jgi:hypothetical protein
MLRDELLLEIFESYISAEDLYRNFLDLNGRLNGFLIFCRLHLTTDFNDLNNPEYVQYLSPRVIGWDADYFNEKFVELFRYHQLRYLHIKILMNELSLQCLKPWGVKV